MVSTTFSISFVWLIDEGQTEYESSLTKYYKIKSKHYTSCCVEKHSVMNGFDLAILNIRETKNKNININLHKYSSWNIS